MIINLKFFIVIIIRTRSCFTLENKITIEKVRVKKKKNFRYSIKIFKLYRYLCGNPVNTKNIKINFNINKIF